PIGKMACDFLSMQPSSVASERALSRAGFKVTNDRANLNENTVSSIILMHSWLKESQKKSSLLEDLPKRNNILLYYFFKVI
ncbi:2324_t:CDS:1, partial [Gigaspora rosea]